MIRYIFKRLVYMIPTLFGMSLIAFLIIQLPPGDYLTSMIASMTQSGQNVDPRQIALLREIYGFDDPIHVQYWKWITGIVTRAVSACARSGPAGSRDRMGGTLTLSIASLLFVWAVSIPIGI